MNLLRFRWRSTALRYEGDMVKRMQHIGTFLHNEMGVSLRGISPMCGRSSIHLQKISHSRWVSARRGPYPVSSRSPLRTGLATFMASGSAPLILLHGVTMKRRFPFLQFHRDSPVYSLRVHWVPLFPSSQRLGAFAISPRPGVPSFPGFRLLCPIRLL